MKTHKIGDKFTYKGLKYEVVKEEEPDSCSGCSFNGLCLLELAEACRIGQIIVEIRKIQKK